MTDEPIQERYHATMNALAEAIDKVLNGDDVDKKIAFTLLITEFNAKPGEGRVNYISNANRDDSISMMAEYIARNAKGKQ